MSYSDLALKCPTCRSGERRVRLSRQKLAWNPCESRWEIAEVVCEHLWHDAWTADPAEIRPLGYPATLALSYADQKFLASCGVSSR